MTRKFAEFFGEFVRVLTPGGIMILHVKNSFSLYWSTLWGVKNFKTVLGWTPQAYYLPFFSMVFE